jgi:SAM-dependent methyltransferase
MNKTDKFYDNLSPYYHLIYPDWDKSILKQADQLDKIIQNLLGGAQTILDVSCGIGTQALGLAGIGYDVTASDLSTGEIDRAKEEAEKRKLNITFSVCDMQKAFEHHAAQFDVVISCDNSVPHLLTDDHILTAFKQFYECTRPGGGCIITVRDYEKEDLSVQQIKPYGIREKRGVRWLAWQVWDPHPPTYDVTMYMIEDRGESDCQTHVMRSVYYAVGIPTLMRLMGEAGFTRIRRQDKGFFQPVIMGERDE